ncbi:hypothetical protein KTH94_18055, partial [Acinetobacter pittii]|uniref:hypothetical protein n=1 Tax=Acinetobacter pittii TaxID=48296 RepID=UPI0021CDE147
TYPSYALNLAQLGALCISNLCATKPLHCESARPAQTQCVLNSFLLIDLQPNKLIELINRVQIKTIRYKKNIIIALHWLLLSLSHVYRNFLVFIER